MKTTRTFVVILSGLFFILTGCKESLYLTEYYIKNKIEKHVPGEKSSIKTYSIFQGTSKANKVASSYIEFTGVKYADTKQLVIGTDILYVAKGTGKSAMSMEKPPTYIILDVEKCQTILSTARILKAMLSSDLPVRNEEIYRDYTVSPDLYISVCKSKGHSGQRQIDVWVAEKKFTLKARKFINKLDRFISY